MTSYVRDKIKNSFLLKAYRSEKEEKFGQVIWFDLGQVGLQRVINEASKIQPTNEWAWRTSHSSWMFSFFREEKIHRQIGAKSFAWSCAKLSWQIKSSVMIKRYCEEHLSVEESTKQKDSNQGDSRTSLSLNVIDALCRREKGVLLLLLYDRVERSKSAVIASVFGVQLCSRFLPEVLMSAFLCAVSPTSPLKMHRCRTVHRTHIPMKWEGTRDLSDRN